MKKLLTILFVFPLICFAQVDGSGHWYAPTGTTNTVQIDGTTGVLLKGTATQYTDIVFPAGQTKVNPATSLPAYNLDSMCLLMVHDADSSERLYFNVQIPHQARMVTIYPHIHWRQQANADTTWNLRMKYRIHGIGEKSGNWVSVNISDRNELTFTALPFHQVAEFPPITVTGKLESTFLDIVIYRYDAVGLATVYMMGFDCHIEVEKLGTKNEYPTP